MTNELLEDMSADYLDLIHAEDNTFGPLTREGIA